VRIACAEAAEVDERQEGGHARGAVAPREAEADVLGDRQVGEERVVLEHHPDAARLGRRPGRTRDDPPTDLDRPGVRSLEARDRAQQGRLAAAGGTEQREDLTACDVERCVTHGRDVAEALGHPFESDRRSHRVRQTLPGLAGTVRP
jgi:hypothetical protein